jgi:hypothetical protein
VPTATLELTTATKAQKAKATRQATKAKAEAAEEARQRLFEGLTEEAQTELIHAVDEVGNGYDAEMESAEEQALENVDDKLRTPVTQYGWDVIKAVLESGAAVNILSPGATHHLNKIINDFTG